MEQTSTIMETQVVGPKHPMFGAKKAWYLFTWYGVAASPGKSFIVEVSGQSAIQFVETVLSDDGAVNTNCAVTASGTGSAIRRSESIDEMEYIDFVNEVVDPRRWIHCVHRAGLLHRSITPMDRFRMALRLEGKY